MSGTRHANNAMHVWNPTPWRIYNSYHVYNVMHVQ